MSGQGGGVGIWSEKVGCLVRGDVWSEGCIVRGSVWSEQCMVRGSVWSEGVI